MPHRIAIQGFEGSFHQIAAAQFFGRSTGILPCATFREVITAAENGNADAAVMAIENSIAGSILPNYNLLHKSSLQVVGEVYLPIQQHLLVNPGVKLADIQEVHSHPMAILQCLDYLTQHEWKLVETEDTALSAKQVRQNNSPHVAAIAGSLAAELFGLDVAAANIHTEKANYTRFLVLQKHRPGDVGTADKASISFQAAHQRGSLAKALTVIADGGINLSKLQSFPVPGSNWQYNFHADMEFASVADFDGVLQRLQPLTQQLKVYGVYKNGKAT